MHSCSEETDLNIILIWIFFSSRCVLVSQEIKMWQGMKHSEVMLFRNLKKWPNRADTRFER